MRELADPRDWGNIPVRTQADLETGKHLHVDTHRSKRLGNSFMWMLVDPRNTLIWTQTDLETGKHLHMDAGKS